jgi:hypothetical protein
MVVPSSSGPNPAPRAMTALVATPAEATIALQPSGTALTETQIKNLQISQPNGSAILVFEVPRLFRTADR